MNRTSCQLVLLLLLVVRPSQADDWPRFRGPSGLGAVRESTSGEAGTKDAKVLPSRWSPLANLAWRTPLPGPGASSPIVVDGKVFVTCYSGYGVGPEPPGGIEQLKRHLVCIDLMTGKVNWRADVKASLPEDSYYKSGVSSHGYASHTPVSDGVNVYVFFGKGGVFAFDMQGKQLWSAEAGKESDPPKWGSACSPILYKNSVIVTAAAESQSIIGFDKATGRKLWRQEAAGLDGMWGTPALVRVDDERTDLVMLVAEELWGLNPDNGKLRWFAQATSSQQAYTSIIADGPRVFAFSGQGGGSLALDAGGRGELGEERTVWTSKINATYASPVQHDDKLYLISRGVMSIVDAKDGRRLQQVRLRGARQTGGPFGSLDYASPIVVGNRLFYLNASGQTFVFGLGEKTELLAVNELRTDKELFWGSPAVSEGRLLLRSTKHLYCVADKGQKVSGGKPASTIAEPTDSQPTNDKPPTRRPGRLGNQRSGSYSGAKERSPVRRPKRPQRPAWETDSSRP